MSWEDAPATEARNRANYSEAMKEGGTNKAEVRILRTFSDLLLGHEGHVVSMLVNGTYWVVGELLEVTNNIAYLKKSFGTGTVLYIQTGSIDLFHKVEEAKGEPDDR